MKKRTLFIAASVALLCSCGNKVKQTTDETRSTGSGQGIKVRTITVTPSNAVDGISYAGTIEEESGTDLSFASAGTIKSLNINEGQSVCAGQVLGALDPTTVNNTVAMASSATQQAKETLNQAQDAYNRMKLLHDKGSLPEIQWVEMQTKLSQAKQMLRQAQASEQIARKGKYDTSLRAPFSGYISRKTSDIGQNVMPGQSVARLVKIDNVKVILSISEDEIEKARIGQKVMFSVSSLGDQQFSGTIKEKDLSADPISRCYKVKALVSNNGHRLLPGMVCDACIADSSAPLVISVPANIVQIDVSNKPFVWTVKGGKAQKTYISLGENVGDNVIVLSGLTSGDKIITDGAQKVYNGAIVNEN